MTVCTLRRTLSTMGEWGATASLSALARTRMRGVVGPPVA